MHLLLVYDIDESRVKKVYKICKKYMIRVQESVFEVKICESKYHEMIEKPKGIIKDDDSIICYFLDKLPYVSREVFGKIYEEENFLI